MARPGSYTLRFPLVLLFSRGGENTVGSGFQEEENANSRDYLYSETESTI
jgi:hypothetical protein